MKLCRARAVPQSKADGEMIQRSGQWPSRTERYRTLQADVRVFEQRREHGGGEKKYKITARANSRTSAERDERPFPRLLFVQPQCGLETIRKRQAFLVAMKEGREDD